MLFGAISFSGRLTRGGWIVTAVLCAIAAGLALLWALEVLGSYPSSGSPERDRMLLGSVAVWVVAALALVGASVRRLRDAGSPLPYLELLIALLIPFLGWLWLLVRLLAVGSHRPAPDQSAGQPGGSPWSGTTRPATEGSAAPTPDNLFARVEAAGRRAVEQPPQVIHDGHKHDVTESGALRHTVTRGRRTFLPGVRKVGF